MLRYRIPARAQLLLLCLLSSSLGAGAAGLSFSYNFSTPDPGGIHSKGLTYLGNNNTARVFYSQAPLRLWDGRTGKQASFNTSFSFAMAGGTIKKKQNGTRPQDRDPPMMTFFVGPWPIPSSMPWYYEGVRMGTSSDDPTSTVISVELNTRWDDHDPAADAVAAADRVDDDDDDDDNDDDDDDLFAGSTVSVDIIYDAGSSVMALKVRLLDDGSGTTLGWSAVNLKKLGLPQDAAVGLSAAQGSTGDYIAAPVVISWSFSSTSTDPSTPLWKIIAPCVATALLVASLVAALIFFILRKRWATTVKTELKAAKELSASTNNNNSYDQKLSAAEVHKGALDDPRMLPVAVKMLQRPMELQTTRKDYVILVTTQRQQASPTLDSW